MGRFCRVGVTTVIVRHVRLEARRESQAKSLALALAELERHRQLDKAA